MPATVALEGKFGDKIAVEQDDGITRREKALDQCFVALAGLVGQPCGGPSHDIRDERSINTGGQIRRALP